MGVLIVLYMYTWTVSFLGVHLSVQGLVSIHTIVTLVKEIKCIW